MWKNSGKRSAQVLRLKGLLGDILEEEIGKKRRRPKLKYFLQIMKNKDCETFRKMGKNSHGVDSNEGEYIKPVLEQATPMIMIKMITLSSSL